MFVMYTVSCESHFDAAHFLVNYPGACKNIHGHRWRVRISVSAPELIDSGAARGMVVDFTEIKKVLRELTGRFDHKLIIETDSLRSTTKLMLEEEEAEYIEVDFRPTAECFAKYFYDEIKSGGIVPSAVRVYESDETFAEYCGE